MKKFWILLLVFTAIFVVRAQTNEPTPQSPNQQDNVALGKTTVASTIENQTYPSKNAVDGKNNTRWSSQYTNGQWLDVDLGSVFNISGVILRWEAAFGAKYDIQVWDGSAWQTVYSEQAGDGKIDDITLAEPVATRYVRMNGIERGSQWGFSVWEFEVYGIPSENADAALETRPTDEAASAEGSGAAGSTTSAASGPLEAEVSAVKSISLLQDSVGDFGKVEVVADIDAAFNNPYDPNDIRVDGRFTSPSGKTVVVPGFYYQDFHDDGGNLTATNKWSWRVRFTPTEVGDWQYQVLATTLKGMKRSEIGTFTVSPSDNPGFVRVDSRNPRYFAFDNGTPYYPIGEDMAWSRGNPLNDYPSWLDKLQTAGGNFIRVWMASWGFGVEWVDTGLGNYAGRQMQAYQLDRLMDMAADHNVYIMLSLLNHGAFNTTTDPQWDQNPYNAANGGPCASPTCFATDATAIKFWHQRLRYIAARWGYSPNIMAFEWWNEINWTGLVNPDILVPWIRESAAYLQSLDPYHHLITHDGSPLGNPQVWNLDSIDFTQDHRYVADILTTFSQVIPQWTAAYADKPFLMGEFGTDAGGAMASDTKGIAIHTGIWSAPMNGAAGSGMTWWWDSYIDPLNLYYQFTGLANFLHGEDLAAQQWQATSASINKGARANVYGLQSQSSALLWVISKDYTTQYIQTGITNALRDALRAQRNAPALYSFEGDANGWALSGDWAAGKGAAVSSDLAKDGTSSLALSATYTGGGTWQEAGAFVQAEGGADWSKYSTISIDVYVPEGAPDFIAQIYAKTGADWTWANSPDFHLTPGEWNTLTVQLAVLGNASVVREFGLKIGSSTAVLDGAFNIDNVRFGGINPDKLVIEFPSVESPSLLLKDLKPGTYTVELWDTIAGTVTNTSSVESTDGTLTIALPTFSGDLAIKVKPQ